MLNSNFYNLKREYVFPIIEKKLEAYQGIDLVNLGIGDVALPLSPTVAEAIRKATREMEGRAIGYGPSLGYDFLRAAIAKRIPSIDADEVHISEGINPDISNVHELFSQKTRFAIPDPAYPVYLDATIMAGNAYELLPCTEENGYLPPFPKEPCDVVFLCNPSNPTGVAMSKDVLASWVLWAKENKALLLVDSAYSAFLSSYKSIYEIPGADEVAIEFCSFSKSAGFTGLRCAYTIVPKKLGDLHTFWQKRQSVKSNGVSYPIQRGALASLDDPNCLSQVNSYLAQARRLRKGLIHLGFSVVGGEESPYIWWKTPNGESSWDFFDLLLERAKVLSVPGLGFGKYGEGHIRLSAFATEATVDAALKRLEGLCATL